MAERGGWFSMGLESFANSSSDRAAAISERDTAGTALSLLGWLSLFYLILPHLVFAAGWLRPAVFVPYVAVLGVVLWRAGRLAVAEWPVSRSYWEARGRAWWPALLLVLAWVALSGAGGIGFQNGDYDAANGMLKDLSFRPWPLQYDLAGTNSTSPATHVYLVYYVAYYLPAAVVGKAAGWIAANVASFLWTYFGVLLAIAWVALIVGIPVTRRAGLALVFLFGAFGGMDWLGYLYMRGPFSFIAHVEWWARLYQYSANTTQLFWVPQHALAPWIATGALIGAARFPGQFNRFVLVLPAACLLWSPFATVGLMPIAATTAVLAWRRGAIHQLIPVGTLATVAAIAAVTVPFFLANRFAFPKGFIFTMGRDTFALPGEATVAGLVMFWVIEFGALALLLFSTGDIPREVRVWAWVAVAGLLVIPLYKAGFYNDSAMRVSIPGLYVLSLTAIAVLFNGQRWNARRVGVLIVLGIGGLTAISEAGRSLRLYHFGPPPVETVWSFPQFGPRDISQRSGRPDAFFFKYLARH